MLSALILSLLSYPAMPLAEQPEQKQDDEPKKQEEMEQKTIQMAVRLTGTDN